ncbi:hypothetical protein [Deferrisoma camini]|uniref:hypothetical protein n=1 Tax=Deferrisoma camini TaxID=1035120 RepID=UPI00046D41A6|nr:hypothetical protein [Deferrisoma camini]
MRVIKQSTAATVMILMVDSTDHVTGKTGLTLTVEISKDGGAFTTISPTVTERGNGWYAVSLAATDTDTVGDLVVRCTATGADPGERVLVVRDLGEGSYSDQDLLRLMAAVLFGKSSGGGTNTMTFRDLADTKDRVIATVDASENRTAMTLDAS